MNNKILTVVLVAGIATTWFAGISAANSGSLSFWNKAEIRELLEKAESWVELTTDEQATLDAAKAMKAEKWAKHGGKRKGGWNLTDEEKTALEAMSDEEKQEFFEAKKAEMKADKEAAKAVIDKLVAGESLTAAEEATRLEMLAKIEENTGKHSKQWSEIIAKILAGDELSADEQTQLETMQAKHAEREAQKAIMQPIRDKVDAGEELTDEEQATLDEAKANKPEWKWKRGGKGLAGDREKR